MATACRKLTVHSPGLASVIRLLHAQQRESKRMCITRVASQSHWSTHWKPFSACTRELCLAIVLANHTYTLIHEPSEVTSYQPLSWHRGSNVTYIYVHIYICVTHSTKRGPFPQKSDCELDLLADSTKSVVHARENR